MKNITKKQTKEKRISFSKYDMEHLYDMAIDNFEKKCFECQYLKKRIERFLGEKSVRNIKKWIKKY